MSKSNDRMLELAGVKPLLTEAKKPKRQIEDIMKDLEQLINDSWDAMQYRFEVEELWTDKEYNQAEKAFKDMKKNFQIADKLL